MKQKCDQCDREATVHEVTVRNGVKIERHLCESCAAQLGITVHSTGTPNLELLKQYVLGAASGTTPTQPVRIQICPACKTTFNDFKQHGILGCETCYAVFEPQLAPLIERAHEGATHHVGKTPRRAGSALPATPTVSLDVSLSLETRAQRMNELRRELDTAITEERYELAAKIRDEMRRLESGETKSLGGKQGGAPEGTSGPGSCEQP